MKIKLIKRDFAILIKITGGNGSLSDNNYSVMFHLFYKAKIDHNNNSH